MLPDLAAARQTLQRSFGYDDFRPGQVDVVASVLSGADTVGVLPTGGGKSLCYQVPALLLPGLTVVISPLISLMKDQVDRLVNRRVAAAFLNSSLSSSDVARRLSSALSGELKLLYVAPERFEAPDLLRTLGRCAISLLAVDEAHCVSEWGHDFRPSYRRIAAANEALGRAQVIALTATATRSVRADITRQLAMRHPRIIVGGFDRANLRYSVRACRSEGDKERALGEAARAHARPSIVYASTRSGVERIARRLGRAGARAAPYHAGLDDARRQEVQEKFMGGGIDTIVATNAFGMGIDKPDVRLVVHYAMPGTLEAYYQEAGRAGRDGQLAHCVLLHTYRDRFTHEWFIHATCPERDVVEHVHAAMNRSHVRGQVMRQPQGSAEEAAYRFLRQRGVLVEQGHSSPRVHVRLLATPARITRELSGRADAQDLGVLRSLWSLGAENFQRGLLVDLDGLPRHIRGRSARQALERLRHRQFVDFFTPAAGLYLARPNAALDRFAIDWDALHRRKSAELAKLDMMQSYVYSKNCRRAFVLRYFGDLAAGSRCAACDNCDPR